MSDLGMVTVAAGQRWRVREGFNGAGFELYVVEVKRKLLSTPVAIVHARRESWSSHELHRLPLDARWLSGIERIE